MRKNIKNIKNIKNNKTCWLKFWKLWKLQKKFIKAPNFVEKNAEKTRKLIIFYWKKVTKNKTLYMILEF